MWKLLSIGRPIITELGSNLIILRLLTLRQLRAYLPWENGMDYY